jgi:hypothetical protein
MARERVSVIDRISDKFLVGDGCWTWTASLDSHGYGQINSGGRGKPLPAHRVVYEMINGPVPVGLDLDHLCRNTVCVRPDHLEPVTRAENIRRGEAGQVHKARMALLTHCKHGHEFTPANTYTGKNANGNPRRVCRKCKAIRERARHAG